MAGARHVQTAAAADAVVVLGAKVVAPGIPGAAIRRRVAHAVCVAEARRIETLLLSGGNGGDDMQMWPSEAAVMRELVLASGIAEERIVTEERSRNTFENGVYTHRIARDRGWRRLTIVTDAWHMRRALYVFRRLGMDAGGDPVRRPPDVSRRAWARAYAGDRAALVRSAWLFWIGRDRDLVEAVMRG
jgi:uncharacterized SAM-binding protein YcdF (DUF218 family)